MMPAALRSPLFVASLGLCLTACGSDPTPQPTPDAAVTPDVMDAARPDVTDVTDAAPPDRAPVDRPPVVCEMEADLTGMTPGSDRAIHVMGDNSASEVSRFGAYPTTCFSGGAVGRFVVYGYTMQAAGALRVSTANTGTTSSFDTFVGVVGACIPAAHVFACNDNASATVRQSTAVSSPLAAGQRVYIVVGGRGASASAIARGAFELSVREIAEGTQDGPCRLTGEACDTGLLCSVLYPSTEAQGVCKRPVAVGATCVAGDLCARGSTCIASPTDNTRGTCTMDGSSGGICNVGRAPCGMGLSCTVSIPAPDNTGLCRPTLMPGMECDPALVTGVCAVGSSCRLSPTEMNPGRYQCFAAGTQGGACRATSPACDASLTCSATTGGTCRAQVALGGACDPTGNATTCAMGSSCAPNAMTVFATGTCVEDGTAVGATCRTLMPECPMDAACAAVAGRNICRAQASGTDPCDWRYGTVVCSMGAACLPGGPSRGVCAPPQMEREPNNTPATGQGPATASAIYRGAITASTDTVDCYRVRVPMGASLYVETNNNAGGCPTGADTIATVYNPMGTRIAENDDIASNNLCSRLNGLTAGPLHGLAAGDYAVCVRSYNAASSIADYYVQIALVPVSN